MPHSCYLLLRTRLCVVSVCVVSVWRTSTRVEMHLNLSVVGEIHILFIIHLPVLLVIVAYQGLVKSG
jgi:hypothetical protein